MKLQTFCLRFQTKEHLLRVNKSEITDKNAFNGDLFEIEDNHEASKNEKTWFQAFLQVCNSCFNRQTVKYLYLRFSSNVWVLQLLIHFLWILDASSKLTQFQTKF